MAKKTLYHNGIILTVDSEDFVAGAVLTEDGTIVAVGDKGELEAQADEIRDLRGQTMIPAFIDPHGHYPDSGILALCRVDLSGTPLGSCNTIAELLKRLSARAAETPKGEWILGGMFDQIAVAEQRFPTCAELDGVSTDHPIWVGHFTGHAGATNSLGLQARGINRDSEDPRGGRFGRDENGDLDGLLDGMTAMGELGDGEFQITSDKFHAACKVAAEEYLSHGVSLAQNAWAPETMLKLFSDVAASRDDIGIDVIVLPAAHMEPALSAGERDVSFPGNTRIKLGPRKLFSDGSFNLQTACITEPYYKPFNGDPEHRGNLAVTVEGMTKHVGALHDAGHQVHVHANGDAAADVMLDAFENVLKASPRDDHRHTFIHCQNYRDDQLDRMMELGLVCSFFPAHLHYWGDMHIDITFGPERVKRMCPLRAAADRGMRFTIHNDATVTPTRPLHLMWCAVSRVSTTGRSLGEEQRITPAEALRAHTIDAAWQVFEDEERGSIEPGKRADFAILSENPLENPTGLKDIQVTQTIVRGETRYKA
ncbi:MAG: amidohydrolase [Rhodospirillales bacterium]|jgi:predicted amidohydrolase YtcJ|nr:amidohydrolase [Rhodospirillales bacterium]MBT4038977.1 amidohydrolase [Rhodospirillales bacterium]MBT4626649.1 amidohydrolase [Rhodospirillales bacterium]MBT5351879.1 amidohydrolase [Rhodospirillales bacterium]MBT5520633.1 amidohydrolase [Rhodospirillales bacterium]